MVVVFSHSEQFLMCKLGMLPGLSEPQPGPVAASWDVMSLLLDSGWLHPRTPFFHSFAHSLTHSFFAQISTRHLPWTNEEVMEGVGLRKC